MNACGLNGFLVTSNDTYPNRTFFRKVESKKEKEKIRLAIIGQEDSGKSTSIGHMLYMCCGTPYKTFEIYERQAKIDFKGSI